MNDTKFTGRTTADIELKVTPAGKNVCNFSLAVKRPYTKDTTDFLDMVAWGKTAEILAKYVSKGDMILITKASAQTRTWKAQDGTNRKQVEFVVEEFEFMPKQQTEQTGGAYSGNDVELEEMTTDDDIPF